MKAWNKNYLSLLNACVGVGMTAKLHASSFRHFYSKKSVWPNLILDITSFDDTLKNRVKNLPRTTTFLLPKANTESICLEGFETLNFSQGLWYEMQAEVNEQWRDLNFENTKIVQTEEELHTWLSIVENVLLGGGKLDYEGIKELWNKKHIYLVLGLYGDKAVSTSMFHFCGQHLGLYFVVTHPEYRGYGLGTQLTQYAYKLGCNLGAQTCVLQATDMGKLVYLKQGYTITDEVDVFSYLKKEL